MSTTALESLSTTTLELVPALDKDRDARVIGHYSGPELAVIEMDDAGYGPFDRVVTKREADILVAEGIVRDAR